MTTAFLLVGLPGTGKTTRAREIERGGALRFSPDEWLLPLFGAQHTERQRDTLEGLLIRTAVRAVGLGVDVVLDFGFWSRAERDALRHLFGTAGADCVVEFLDLDPAVQLRRVRRRQLETPHATFLMTPEDLERWRAQFEVPTAAELAAEPPPPTGFATWSAWAATRWPSLPDLTG